MTPPSTEQNWSADVVAATALSDELVRQWQLFVAVDPLLESPFYSVAFARAVACVHPNVYVGILRQGSEVKAFLPFQFPTTWHRMLGAAERVGGEMSDYFGLVAAGDVQIQPRDLLRLCRLTSLEFSHLDETQARFGLKGHRPTTGLRIRLSAGSAVYWDNLRRTDKKLVADTERRLRKLVEIYGPLRFELRASDIKLELLRLIEAKRDQYTRTGVGDALGTKWREDLLTVLADTRDSQCSGILSVLYAGDTWIASHFGLSAPRLLHYWFPVYNPDLKAFSPGRLLLKSIIDAADAAGIHVIDRGDGDHPAKREFANESHFYSRDLWSVPGPRSLLFRSLQSLTWRLAARRQATIRGTDSRSAEKASDV